MQEFVIEGGKKLTGKVSVSGAKNEALPVLAASLLADDEITITNLPLTEDVFVQIEILRLLGCKVSFIDKNTLTINPTGLHSWDIPNRLASLSRGSILFMGALLSRFHKVSLGLPGGDYIGPRPIDLHLKGFKAMGANVEIKKGRIELTAKKLRGAEIFLDRPSTTATENILMTGSLADGITIIENAERTPGVLSFINFLKKMNAKIKCEPNGVIKVKGVARLGNANHKLIPDPIETGTYMVASVITKGNVLIDNAIYNHCLPTIAKLSEAGVKIKREHIGVRVVGAGTIRPVNIYASAPYPAFHTDLQPIFTALMSTLHGKCKIIDSVWPHRFGYVSELRKMGAKIEVKGNSAIVEGVEQLIGTKVEAKDIRGGGALVLAGLSAEGETIVTGLHQIDRGYEDIEKKLSLLGANIRRV